MNVKKYRKEFEELLIDFDKELEEERSQSFRLCRFVDLNKIEDLKKNLLIECGSS